MKFCSRCGAQNDGEAKFCVTCGHPFMEPSGQQPAGGAPKGPADAQQQPAQETAPRYTTPQPTSYGYGQAAYGGQRPAGDATALENSARTLSIVMRIVAVVSLAAFFMNVVSVNAWGGSYPVSTGLLFVQMVFRYEMNWLYALGTLFLLWPVVGALFSFAKGKGYAKLMIVYGVIELILGAAFYISISSAPDGSYSPGVGGYIFLIVAAFQVILGVVCQNKYKQAGQ